MALIDLICSFLTIQALLFEQCVKSECEQFRRFLSSFSTPRSFACLLEKALAQLVNLPLQRLHRWLLIHQLVFSDKEVELQQEGVGVWHGLEGLQVTKVAVVDVDEDPEEAGEHLGGVFLDEVLGKGLVTLLGEHRVVV